MLKVALPLLVHIAPAYGTGTAAVPAGVGYITTKSCWKSTASDTAALQENIPLVINACYPHASPFVGEYQLFEPSGTAESVKFGCSEGKITFQKFSNTNCANPATAGDGASGDVPTATLDCASTPTMNFAEASVKHPEGDGAAQAAACTSNTDLKFPVFRTPQQVIVYKGESALPATATTLKAVTKLDLKGLTFYQPPFWLVGGLMTQELCQSSELPVDTKIYSCNRHEDVAVFTKTEAGTACISIDYYKCFQLTTELNVGLVQNRKCGASTEDEGPNAELQVLQTDCAEGDASIVKYECSNGKDVATCADTAVTFEPSSWLDFFSNNVFSGSKCASDNTFPTAILGGECIEGDFSTGEHMSYATTRSEGKTAAFFSGILLLLVTWALQ